MRYLTLHHNAYYFQIRVPAVLRAEYGPLVRLNLGTSEREVARPLALQLAAYWLTRFSAESVGDRTQFKPPASIAPLLSTAESPVKPGTQLRMADAFAYWRDLVAKRPERTVLEFGSTADDFDERINIELSRLQRSDIARYRDLLLAQGLAPATVTKRLGFVNALLQSMHDAGRLPVNVARGLRVPRAKVVAARRREFRAEELRVLFASPIYSAHKRPRGCGGEAAVWLPVLGLVTGARLEELSQLRSEDVVLTDGGRLLLRIEDDGEVKRLKTSSSRRVVPVHPAAIASGFAQYVESRRTAGDAWLFPDLKADRFSRSGQWSKWFGNYLRSARGCGISDRRVVFHSLRHVFKSLCRAAGIAEEVHDALTGHSGGVGRDYGSVPVAVLIDAVERIELPVLLPTIAAE